jgi:hypothetical protein
MAISMYSASVPVFVKMLGNLTSWFDKAEAHAAAKKFEPEVLLAARLAPDMLPLVKQVQIACDTAKFCVARLSGAEAPKFDDSEKNFGELRQRVKKTIEFLKSVPEAQLAGTEEREISVPTRTGSTQWKGEAYLKEHALPNFFFHATTTYALLRHNGVEVGKGDYLRGAQ